MDTGYYGNPGKNVMKRAARTKGKQQNEKIRKEKWTRVTQKSPSPTDEKGAIETYGLPRKKIQEFYERFGKKPEKVNEYLKHRLEYVNPDIIGLEEHDVVNFGFAFTETENSKKLVSSNESK